MEVIKNTMPNGAVVWYRPSDHSYFEDYNEASGKCSGKVPGISTISKADGSTNKDGLLQWAVNLANRGIDHKEERDRLGVIGQGAHDVLEALALGKEIECKTLQDRAVKAWWESDQHLIPNDCEQIVYSPLHGFAGRYDLFASSFVDGYGEMFQLWDLKTGSMKPEYLIQLNLYHIARNEVGFTPADELWILHIDKQGGYSEIPVPIEPSWAFTALNSYNNHRRIRRHLSKAQREATVVGVTN